MKRCMVLLLLGALQAAACGGGGGKGDDADADISSDDVRDPDPNPEDGAEAQPDEASDLATDLEPDDAPSDVSADDAVVDELPDGGPRFFGISPTASHAVGEGEWLDYRELGIESVRIHLQQGHDWSAYDAVVDRCMEEGIEVMMLVSYESYASEAVEEPAPWGGTWLRYTDVMELVDTLAAAVPHFRDRGVHAWEIWNEENGTWHVMEPDYAQLLAAVYEKFKYTDRWDPGATVVFGGLDAVAWFDPLGGNGAARQYLINLYGQAAFTDFMARYGHPPYDAMAIHPYGAETTDKFNYNLSSVCLETMEAHGHGALPIWITELGDANEADAVQADMLEHYVRASFNHPSVQRLHWFKYTYPGSSGHAFYSLVMDDGRHREAYYRYRDLIAELTGA